jgi:hypothetical protein
MTLGIIVHSGDLANIGDKINQIERFLPDIYVEELGYNQDHATPLGKNYVPESLYRMQPKEPDKQIARALERSAAGGYRSLVLRMIEFPLKEQQDYAFKISETIKYKSNIKILSPLNYMVVKDSITYRVISNLPHTINLLPIIRLTTENGMMSQMAGALATLSKSMGGAIAPCLQIVGGEVMTTEQIDTFCQRVLAASSTVYLWSLGTVAGNPIAEHIMNYVKTTYPNVGKGDIDMDQPIVIPGPQVERVERSHGLMGTVAISDLSVRKDCSLAAKIVSSMQMGDRVEYEELVWANKDLSFVHMTNGYWAVQHWSGIDYIILDETDNIKSSGGAL